MLLDCHMVPTMRLELTRLSPLPPQDSVSTNFTTSALFVFKCAIVAFFYDFGAVFPLVFSTGADVAGAAGTSAAAGAALFVVAAAGAALLPAAPLVGAVGTSAGCAGLVSAGGVAGCSVAGAVGAARSMMLPPMTPPECCAL